MSYGFFFGVTLLPFISLVYLLCVYFRFKIYQELVMRVSFGSWDFTGNVYLTGTVYDTFDGRGWRQDWQGYPGEVFLDTAETLYGVRGYNEEYRRDYVREVSLKIRYEDFSTGYAFAPLKTWSLEKGESGKLPDYNCVGGSLRWTRQKGYGTEYGLHYFRMNAGQREFDAFLEAALESSRMGRDVEGEAGSGGAGKEAAGSRKLRPQKRGERTAGKKQSRRRMGIHSSGSSWGPCFRCFWWYVPCFWQWIMQWADTDTVKGSFMRSFG